VPRQNDSIKILHFGLFKTMGAGVKQQLIDEFSASKYLDGNINWEIAFFSHDQPSEPFMKQPKYPLSWFKRSRLLRYLILRLSAYRWLLQNKHQYDAILFRYPLGDPTLPYFIRHIDNFFTIHHTNELGEIDPSSSLISKVHLWIEKRVGRFVLSRAKGVVGLTGEILDQELKRIPTISKNSYVTPNGIDLKRKTISFPDTRGGTIKLVCVCSKAYPWQGIDLIVNGVVNSDIKDIELHLIGDISPNDFSGDSRIIYHGVLPPNEIPNILAHSDLGLGSFALYRKDMLEACTLKVREYLCYGLPVYAHHVDSGLPHDYCYFINQEFNVQKAYKMAKTFRKISRQDVRESAEEFIDKQHITQRLANWLADQHT
jgi:glycosyltransferase involved in cell wall biosynthesis